MRALSVETSEPPNPLPQKTTLERVTANARMWLTERLTKAAVSRLWFSVMCAAVLLTTVGVRLLYWQDSYVEIAQKRSWNPAIARNYENDARRMLKEGGVLFPNGPVDPGDARIILHPPGYSAFMAGVFALSEGTISSVRLAQVLADSLSALLVFLIALELFPFAVAIIAALLVAFSPHLAFYSLWISPDSLCVLPVLVAVYFLIKASKRPRLGAIIAAGAMVGVSCWLRANALLLAPFMAAVVLLVFERGKRLGYAMAFTGAALLVVSPITIRNWILFHHFIPISIAGGENLVVGIADFDKEGRFGMPTSDADAGVKDAEWANRPDYADSAWLPDGVERDQARYERGLAVIRSNPGWFVGIMFKRALFMLRYNDDGPSDWPFNTSRAPIVSAEPPVQHTPFAARDMQPSWSSAGRDLIDNESILSKDTLITFEGDGQSLRIAGDGSEFGDQFASTAMPVKPKTDYVARLTANLEHGQVAAKITSLDRRIALASAILNDDPIRSNKKKGDNVIVKPGAEDGTRITEMPFTSGSRSEVRLVISNNGLASTPIARVSKLELFDLGATPYQWIRLPRALVRGLQKPIFKTGVLLPIVIVGVLLMSLAGRGRSRAIVLAVPAYYLLAQSALSTEYRYILAIHYFLFMMGAVTFACAGSVIVNALAMAVRASRRIGADSPAMSEDAV